MQIHEPEELREGLNVYFGREGLETVRSGENINKGRQFFLRRRFRLNNNGLGSGR